MKSRPFGHRLPRTVVFSLLSSILLLAACRESPGNRRANGPAVNPSGQTLRNRVRPPEGYEWVQEDRNSFGAFLQGVRVKAPGSPVLDFQGRRIFNQSEHVAVINYDVGNRDLQQCADAVIRLHAEYLYAAGRHNDIVYQFTNGDRFAWTDYRRGIRPRLVNANTVSFVQQAGYDDSYWSFRKYLDHVFAYAGTISLNRQTSRVSGNSGIRAGDVIVNPGSPGHAVIIAGRARNRSGKTVYLLAQGYTPAQSIHVLTNPFNSRLNPWYELNVSARPLRTARYTFPEANIRSFR